jgi:hypothetical protein
VRIGRTVSPGSDAQQRDPSRGLPAHHDQAARLAVAPFGSAATLEGWLDAPTPAGRDVKSPRPLPDTAPPPCRPRRPPAHRMRTSPDASTHRPASRGHAGPNSTRVPKARGFGLDARSSGPPMSGAQSEAGDVDRLDSAESSARPDARRGATSPEGLSPRRRRANPAIGDTRASSFGDACMGLADPPHRWARGGRGRGAFRSQRICGVRCVCRVHG